MNLRIPKENRVFYIKKALELHWSVDTIYSLTSIDPWFLNQLKELVDAEHDCISQLNSGLSKDIIVRMKQWGYSDRQLAYVAHKDELTLL